MNDNTLAEVTKRQLARRQDAELSAHSVERGPVSPVRRCLRRSEARPSSITDADKLRSRFEPLTSLLVRDWCPYVLFNYLKAVLALINIIRRFIRGYSELQKQSSLVTQL